MANKSSYIKSYQLNFDLSDSTESKLKKLKTAISDAKNQANALKQLLSKDWNSTDFTRAQENAQKAVALTRQKVQIYREELDKAMAPNSEKTESEIAKISTSLDKAKLEAQKAYQQLIDINNISYDRIITKLETISTNIDKVTNKSKYLSAAAVAGIVAVAKASIDYEDAFAGVVKTVDGTDEQLNKLSDDIRAMSLEIPKSAKELAGISEQAGQLGIKTNDIAGFTKTIAELETAAPGLTDSASALAKFANVTNMSSENYDRLASVIVDLGNKSATTEQDIVTMATRLASAGSLARFSQAQIMGVSAALSSVGIEAEAGGTAMTKLTKQIQLAVETGSADLADFASVAGMSSSEFTKAFQTDAARAVASFINGLKDTERNGKSAIAMLDDMGLTEVRLSNSILALANSDDILSKSLDISSTAWTENNALTTEAEKKYKTKASQIQITKNAINDMSVEIGENLLPVIADACEDIKNLTKWFNELDKTQQNNILRLGVSIALFTPLLSGISKFIKFGQGIVTMYKAYKTSADAAKAAQVGVNVAQSSSPAGALATVLSMVIAAFASYAISCSIITDDTYDFNKELEKTIKTYDDAKKAANEQSIATIAEGEEIKALVNHLYNSDDAIRSNKSTTADLEKAKKDLITTIDELNEKIPDLKLTIDSETGALANQREEVNELTNAYYEMTVASAMSSAYQNKMNAAAMEIADLKQKRQAVSDKSLETIYEEALKASGGGMGAGFLTYEQKMELASAEKQRQITEINAELAQANIELDKNVESMSLEKNKYENLITQYFPSKKENESPTLTSSADDVEATEAAEKAKQDAVEASEKAEQETAEKAAAEAKKAAEEAEKAAQELLNNRLNMISELESAINEFTEKCIKEAQKEADAKIAAIDAELAARKKLKEEKESENAEAALAERIARETDNYSREQLQKELNEKITERKDAEAEASAQAKKDEINATLAKAQEEVRQVQQIMQAKLSAVTAKLQGSTTNNNSVVNEIKSSMTVNGAGLTPAQMQSIIDGAYNKLLKELSK